MSARLDQVAAIKRYEYSVNVNVVFRRQFFERLHEEVGVFRADLQIADRLNQEVAPCLPVRNRKSATNIFTDIYRFAGMEDSQIKSFEIFCEINARFLEPGKERWRKHFHPCGVILVKIIQVISAPPSGNCPTLQSRI